MMPKEFRKKTKGIEGYINYSMQNGFTGSSFIFPDTRTRVDFKTYTQFSNNQTILEGFEFGFSKPSGLNLGAWLDEYLGDSALVNTLRFRLATRNSKLLIGFTPLDGYTPFISEYLKGAEVLETRAAELLDNKQVPVKQYSPERDASIVYLHSDENPFGGYERIAKDLRGRSKEDIMVRAYGLPVKSMTSLLPLFSTDIYILREWPDRATYGEWALFGDPKWKYGPASKKIGLDVRGYVELFEEIEDDMGMKVMERIGDSRYFARENENNTDLFSSFEDYGMVFLPSDGKTEDIGIAAVDEWFTYNPNYDIDEANRPRCFIHEDCENLIDSLINYNSNGKMDEALKDFFDLIRYLRMSNGGLGPDHFTSRDMQATSRAQGGY
jgi:hypothetical protein